MIQLIDFKERGEHHDRVDKQTISKHAALKAEEFFLQKLRKHREYIARRPPHR